MALIRVKIKETLLRTMILFLAGAQMDLNSTSPNINSVYTPHPLFYSRNQYVSLSNTGKTICRDRHKKQVEHLLLLCTTLLPTQYVKVSMEKYNFLFDASSKIIRTYLLFSYSFELGQNHLMFSRSVDFTILLSIQ